MISLRHLSKSFGPVQAVRGVSLEVPAGQIVGVLGPNGAGKSTTIRMITGMVPPTSGTAQVDGLDCIARSREVRRRLGYLPENNPLYPEMRVADYLGYRARLYGLAGRAVKRAVDAAAGRTNLGDVFRRRVGQLSKGYRQRVGLAAALLHEPPVLILDEPTSGLDPSQIAETRRLIRDLAGRRTMLLVSHILPEVEKTCDRIIVFARGRIRADGTPRELLGRDAARARAFIVEAQGPQAEAALRATPGVESVRGEALEGGWSRYTVTRREGAPDLRPAIAEALLKAGAAVRELRAETASLEEFYIRLTERTDEEERDSSPAQDSRLKPQDSR